MRIRVTTRTDLFEERKRQHIERGFRIEDERPIPANGLCSFIAVKEEAASDPVGELAVQALNGRRGRVAAIEALIRWRQVTNATSLTSGRTLKSPPLTSSLAS